MDQGGNRPPPRKGKSRPPRRAPRRDTLRDDHPEHDVLIFPRKEQLETTGQFIRLPAVAADEVAGARDGKSPRGGPKRGIYRSTSEAWDLLDYGARRALSAARPDLPQREDPPEKREARQEERAGVGPGFAVLPVKPEPSSASFATCYLLNVEHLAGRNYWTVEEWSDSGQTIDFVTPLHPDEFEALIAGPWGKVYRLKVSHCDLWTHDPIQIKRDGKLLAELEDVDLRMEPQIWHQLRNGTVAGRAWLRRDTKAIPLVNITALGQELPFEAKDKSDTENSSPEET